jgi:hypothetical protein
MWLKVRTYILIKKTCFGQFGLHFVNANNANPNEVTIMNFGVLNENSIQLIKAAFLGSDVVDTGDTSKFF